MVTSQVSTRKSTEILKMSWLTKMRTVGLSLCTLTVPPSMWGSHPTQSYHRAQSVSQLIDLSLPSTFLQGEVSCSSWVPCSFSVTNSSRRRTIRRFRKQSSDGYSTMKENLSPISRMNQSWASIIMFQTLWPWQTNSDLVSKNLMSSQRTSQLSLTKSCISSILISSQRPWTFTPL